MGRRRSGKRRRSSHGEGGGPKTKSPTKTQPGSPATTSLATSPKTAWVDSSFGEVPKAVSECSSAQPPISPGAGSCEDNVRAEWVEAYLSEDAADTMSSPDGPVQATLADIIDCEMDEEPVMRLTETPESKRRSLKVSHSEKVFAKKVMVTPVVHTEDQREKFKAARDTTDLKLKRTDDGARRPEQNVDITTVKSSHHVGRIADKISLFESCGVQAVKRGSTNLQRLDISPARKVSRHLREFTGPAETRSSSAPPSQTVKERALNFNTGQRRDETFALPSGRWGVSGQTLKDGHSKTTGQTSQYSENIGKPTANTRTSWEKPEVKLKAPSNTDQTDSKSQNSTLSESKSDSKNGNKEAETTNCSLQTVSSPTDETSQVKSPSRTGSRSKKRRSKDVVQPLSPTSKNKKETVQGKQALKDEKSTLEITIDTNPLKDTKNASETTDKYLKSTSEKAATKNSEEIVKNKPKVPQKLANAMEILPSTKKTQDSDSQRLPSPQTVTSAFGTQPLCSPTSRKKNSQTESSSIVEQIGPVDLKSETEEKQNFNKKQPVTEHSEREQGEEQKNRGTIVNTLFGELGEPDPSVTKEEKPPSPEDLKEGSSEDLSAPANSIPAASWKDAMQNRENETDEKVLPEKDTATCVPQGKSISENDSKSDKVQTLSKRDQKDCLTAITNKSKKNYNVTETTNQNLAIKSTVTPKHSNVVNTTKTTKQNIDEENNLLLSTKTTEKDTTTELTSQTTEKDRALTTTNSEDLKNQNDQMDSKISPQIPPTEERAHKKGGPSPSSQSESREEQKTQTAANDRGLKQEQEGIRASTETEGGDTTETQSEMTLKVNGKKRKEKKGDQSGEKIFCSSNEDTFPAIPSINENLLFSSAKKKPTSLSSTANDIFTEQPGQANEKAISKPASTDETASNLPASVGEKAVPLTNSLHEKNTSPPAFNNEKTTPPPASCNEKTTPPPASLNEKTTPPPTSSNEKTTTPLTSLNEKTRSPPASSNEKTTPPPAFNNENSTPPSASSNEKTMPPLASSKEKTTPPPASCNEKSTPPPASLNEKTTPPPASSNEKTTTPLTSLNEKTTPPPALSDEKTTPPPAFNNENPMPPSASSNKKATPPHASCNKNTTPPSASSNKKATPPPTLSNEKTTTPLASSNKKTTPPPTSLNEKSTPPPTSSNEKTMPPLASSNEKTTPPPASCNEKTTPPPASLNEKTAPPPTSSKEKSTTPLTSLNEKTRPPPALSDEKTTPPPAFNNENPAPPSASSNKKTTTPPASCNKNTTPPPASLKEKNTPPPTSSNEKTMPPLASSNEKTTPPPASCNEKTTPPPASLNEKTAPPPTSSKEKSTTPLISLNEKSTPPPTSSNGKTTPPLASSNEKTTPPPASRNENTTPPPTSLNEKSTPPPTSSNEKTTPPLASSNEKTTPPPASCNEKTTPPPISSDEKTIKLHTSFNEKTAPSPALYKEKTTPPIISTNEKTTPPSALSNEKTIPSPTSSNGKTTPPTASLNEKTTPPLASLNEKITPSPTLKNEKNMPHQVQVNEVSHTLASASEKSPSPLSPIKHQSTDQATRKKEFIPKPFILPQIPSAPGRPSLNRDSPSSWLDVDHQQPKRKNQFQTISEPKLKLSSSVSETNLLDKSGEFDPDDFIANVKRLAMPFSLPQRKHNQLRLQAPPFAMPAIREVRCETPFDPEEFQFGLRRRKREFTLDMAPTSISKSQNIEDKEDVSSTPKQINPERESILTRSLLFQRAKKEPEEKDEGQKKEGSEERKTEPLARSRLERCSILNSLRNPSRVRRMDLLSPTEHPSEGLLSPSDAPGSSTPQQTHPKPTAESPKQDKVKEVPANNEQTGANSTQTGSQVDLKPMNYEGPAITLDLNTTSENPTVTMLTDTNASHPPSFTHTGSQVIPKPAKDDGLVVTPDRKSISADPTVSIVTEANGLLPSNCTKTSYQVAPQPIKDDGPARILDLTTTLEDSMVTMLTDTNASSPNSCNQTNSQVVLKLTNNDVPAMTSDLKTSVNPTITMITEADGPPPLPSFDDIKLPSYVEKFLPKEPERVPPSHKIDSLVTRESDYIPDLNQTVKDNAAITEDLSILPSSQPSEAQTSQDDIQREQPNIPAVRGFHRRPGKIVIFEHHQFSGHSFEFYRDEPDATHLQLSSVISVKVVRGCWILFEKPGFEGRCIALEEEGITELPNEWAEEAGQTSTPMIIGSIRLSVRDYTPPRIELFMEPSGMGRNFLYVEDTEEVGSFGLPQNTSSIKVHSGLWMVYSDPGFQGLLAVLEVGEYPIPESWGFPSPMVGSMRALRMGVLKVENPNGVKAVLYEKAGLKGHCMEVQGDVFSFRRRETDRSDLDGHGLRCVESLKIIGGLWVGYEREGFEGQQFVLEEGEYLDWRDWGGMGQKLLSLRPVITDVSSPHMKMFNDFDFGERGGNIDLLEPLENTAETSYGPHTCSIDVLSGVWVAFEDPGFSGQLYVLEKGLYGSPEDWGASNSRISSVIPVTQENLGGTCHFKIQLFSEAELSGMSVLLDDSLPTMPDGFTMRSCRVLAGSWLAFAVECFSGPQCVLEEGIYPDLRSMGFTQHDASVMSLQPTGHEFSLPSIGLFERSGLRGRRTLLKSSSVNLQFTDSCTRVSSILVEGGMWVLYESNNFRGSQFLLRPGVVPDWSKLSDWPRIGSLRPLIQKQAHFRLRNKEVGLLMSITGQLGDIKLMRIQAAEETGGMDQIWLYRDGQLQCMWLADCCVDVSSGVPMAGSRAVLSSEPGQSQQLWNITTDGLIRNNAAPNLVLEIKGGQQFDKTQIILNEFNPNKMNQRWSLEIL
ncbi:beta/gamma crystallin domain-containing protein 1 [Myxocyprinus asiaticus]|uniref:beta/gamma crystallin domain-containing protein 1 n=1 Tax=Myxocyprinus asiaticus TaxID=70543 RepID=UPI002222F5A4|nr:beta/gamma crystallin domain-containing protein 1 [Myxocyprinus asiaticus]